MKRGVAVAASRSTSNPSITPSPQAEEDPFDLFGLERSFAIDEAALEQAYLRLQAQFHPDLYANADEVTRTKASLNSCVVNDAYETLKDAVKRSVCLIRLAGGEANALSEGTIGDTELLEEALELRQALAEADTKDQLAEIARHHNNKTTQCLKELTEAFAIGNIPEADKQTVKLRYLNRLSDEIRRFKAKCTQ